MKKLIPLLILFAACSKKEVRVPQQVFTLSVDSVLNQKGTNSLPIDNNGYYHFKMPLGDTIGQIPTRITGKILLNGSEPLPPQQIDWESNLYWILQPGDTIANITKSYINYYTGQYTIVKLPPLVNNQKQLVPTINPVSISGKNGEINIMIAPIQEMRGDTMIIKTTHSISNKIIYTKIVLQ
jgi:hypothetical protein